VANVSKEGPQPVVREQFRQFLLRPDPKQAEVTAFQAEFNRIERVLRSDPDTKAELHLRAEQLQETLWPGLSQATERCRDDRLWAAIE
jgi:hypothetical protein